MRIFILAISLMVVASCHVDESDSDAKSYIGEAPAGKSADDEIIVNKQLYYAAMRLYPVEPDSGKRRQGKPIKVVFRVLLHDGNPKTLWLYDISKVNESWNPTQQELDNLHRAVPLQFEKKETSRAGILVIIPYYSHTIKHKAKNSWGQEFVLQWNEMKNGSIVDDRVVDKFVIWAKGRYRSPPLERSFYGGHLSFPTETVISRYFSNDANSDEPDIAEAYANTVSAIAKHRTKDLKALCGDSLSRSAGVNGYKVDREGTCGEDLLIRVNPGVYRRIKKHDHDIACEIVPKKGVKLSKGNDVIEMTDCDYDRLEIHANWVAVDYREDGEDIFFIEEKRLLFNIYNEDDKQNVQIEHITLDDRETEFDWGFGDALTLLWLKAKNESVE